MDDSAEDTSSKETHIILIDADEEACDLAKATLGEANFAVHTYSDANRVLRVLEGKLYRRLFDWAPGAIIVDISLPKMSGYEFVRRVMQYSYAPNIPILMMSRYQSYEDEVEALNVGANGLLIKPVKPERVREMMAKFKDRRRRVKSSTLVFGGSMDDF